MIIKIIKIQQKIIVMSEYIFFLKQYELNNKLLHKLTNEKTTTKYIVNKDSAKLSYLPSINSYFWFYYIWMYGNDYKKSLETETKEKIRCIELVRQNKSLLKTIKVKRVDFEEDLLYSKHINLSTLMVLALYNNLSFIIQKNKCYYFFNYGKQIHLLQNKCYYLDIDSICYKNIVDTCYRLDNIHKLLYAISYYKVSDLQEICNKLDIDHKKYKLKKELYDSIMKKLTQMI